MPDNERCFFPLRTLLGKIINFNQNSTIYTLRKGGIEEKISFLSVFYKKKFAYMK